MEGQFGADGPSGDFAAGPDEAAAPVVEPAPSPAHGTPTIARRFQRPAATDATHVRAPAAPEEAPARTTAASTARLARPRRRRCPRPSARTTRRSPTPSARPSRTSRPLGRRAPVGHLVGHAAAARANRAADADAQADAARWMDALVGLGVEEGVRSRSPTLAHGRLPRPPRRRRAGLCTRRQ